MLWTYLICNPEVRFRRRSFDGADPIPWKAVRSQQLFGCRWNEAKDFHFASRKIHWRGAGGGWLKDWWHECGVKVADLSFSITWLYKNPQGPGSLVNYACVSSHTRLPYLFITSYWSIFPKTWHFLSLEWSNWVAKIPQLMYRLSCRSTISDSGAPPHWIHGGFN